MNSRRSGRSLGVENFKHSSEVFNFSTYIRRNTELQGFKIFQQSENAYSVIRGCKAHPIHGGISDTPGRIINNTDKRFIVMGIYGETEIGKNIFNFLAPIKGDTGINAVGNIKSAKGFLKGARLNVGTIEYGEVFIVEVEIKPRINDGFGYLTGFIAFIGRAKEPYSGTFTVIGPDGFGYLVFVVGDDGVCSFDDVLRRTIVLFEFEKKSS